MALDLSSPMDGATAVKVEREDPRSANLLIPACAAGCAAEARASLHRASAEVPAMEVLLKHVVEKAIIASGGRSYGTGSSQVHR